MYEKLYRELLLRYNELERENKRLLEETQQLRNRLGLREIPEENIEDSVTQAASVNKYSSSKEKIELFRSLFRGREDVFARRWQSTASGKSGYQPVCENEWVEGLCDKRKYKCANCPNRLLKPLTDEDIYKHLEGKDGLARDVIGIYPMLQDETCNFLCADFDDEAFEKDVSTFRKTCKELDIPVCVERSRSGNGVHAWIFFDIPISAATARKLGSDILTKAMERRGELSFKSYDRLFPNQDTMPEGGFGNLVALPLQGLARKSGNSVFVDEQFHPYDDQWAYLSTVKRVSADTVETLVAFFGKDGELGKLVSESDSKPWETKKKVKITHCDFPMVLNIVRANMLYIPTAELSANAKNQIKRLAAFKNPDFYRAQAMRLPIYDKPRIICTADITEDYIAISRGCEDALCNLLDEADASYTIEDKTNAGDSIPVSFNGELREEQQPAADALLDKNIGVLSATTAFGKTVITSYMIGQRKTNTLILVHTQALMSQWKKSLESFLHFDIIPPEEKKGRGRKKVWSPVGVLGAGKDTLHGILDVAVMQSLVNGDEVKELVRNYGMIIVDECHHLSAVNFEMILKYANAKYVYGLTATPTRQDGHHPIIFMQCGAIRYSSCIDNIRKLVHDFEATHSVKYISDLEEFISESNYEDFYVDSEAEVIYVSTIHKSKGREFDSVYMMLKDAHGKNDEERRKLYVGMTRAKSNLFIHVNTDLFAKYILPDVIHVADSNDYSEPSEIVLQTTHRDVVLDYFKNKKEIIFNLRGGTKLKMDDVYLVATLNGRDVRVAKISKAFVETLEKLKDKGYSPKSAEVRFVVAWTGEEGTEETPIILADIYFAK